VNVSEPKPKPPKRKSPLNFFFPKILKLPKKYISPFLGGGALNL